jgi:hypothetical protein
VLHGRPDPFSRGEVLDAEVAAQWQRVIAEVELHSATAEECVVQDALARVGRVQVGHARLPRALLVSVDDPRPTCLRRQFTDEFHLAVGLVRVELE